MAFSGEQKKQKRILVLSGGESKGDGQAGAAYTLWRNGWRWDEVIGTSVGAYNGAMIAQDKWQELKELWNSLSNKDVYTGKLNVWNTIKALVTGRTGILGRRPIERLIEKHVGELKIPLHVGVTQWETGEKWYVDCKRETKRAKDFILASGVMPLAWKPVKIMGGYWYDGGIRDNVGLSRAIELGATHVTVIMTQTHGLDQRKDGPRNLFDVAGRALGMMMSEVAANDINETLRINDLVRQAEAQGVKLYSDSGRLYRHVDIDIIYPYSGMPWGRKLMDFESREWDYGVMAANDYLSNRANGKKQ